MAKRKTKNSTHFEQVPIEVVRKIAEPLPLKRKASSPARRKPAKNAH